MFNTKSLRLRLFEELHALAAKTQHFTDMLIHQILGYKLTKSRIDIQRVRPVDSGTLVVGHFPDEPRLTSCVVAKFHSRAVRNLSSRPRLRRQ